MDFGGVAMQAQLVDVSIGGIQSGDLLSGEVGGKSVLPVLVFAFDFAFGLWGGSIAEGDVKEFEGLTQSPGARWNFHNFQPLRLRLRQRCVPASDGDVKCFPSNQMRPVLRTKARYIRPW
jgi:hypothetical protein